MQNFNEFNNQNNNPILNPNTNPSVNPNHNNLKLNNGMNTRHDNQIPNGYQSVPQNQYYNSYQPMGPSIPQTSTVGHSLANNPSVNSMYGSTHPQTNVNPMPMRPQLPPNVPQMATHKQLGLKSESNPQFNQYLPPMRTQPQQTPTNGHSLPSVPSMPVSSQSYGQTYAPQQQPFPPTDPQKTPLPHSRPILTSHETFAPKAVPPPPQMSGPPVPPLRTPLRPGIPTIAAQPLTNYNISQSQAIPPPPMNSYSSSGRTALPPQRPNDSFTAQPIHTQTQQPIYNGVNYNPSAGQSSMDSMTSKMAGMSVNQSWNQMWSQECLNLMTEKDIRMKAILTEEQKRSNSQNNFEISCHKEIMRSTLTKVPDSASLLQKARLPLGILIHPFKTDEENIPVIQDSPIVRCRSCRTYINPYVRLLDQRRWQCNLCLRINEIPEEFLYDPNTRQSIDCMTRPELNYSSIEYIASVEYMVRPPQPAAYLFVFDISQHATQVGYIPTLAKALLDSLDEIPGDSRTLIGFIAFDSKLHFFNFGDKQPIHLVMPDIQDVFLPNSDNLLVNLNSKRTQIQEFLTEILPTFSNNSPNDVTYDSGSALGPALSVAYKVLSSLGGRITLIQATLPNVGNPNEGSVLTNREDPNKRTSNTNNLNALTPLLNPGTDFYKKLALECSEHQIAVDLFNLSQSYSDLSTVGSVSKFSGGSVHYYGGSPANCVLSRFGADMRHYLTRNIGFEAVMRMRCTRGLSIHTFHGNFFVRSTDLLALPNVNPDSGYGMQISIDEDLKDYTNVCFQAAILYTSANGERRIRVHTLCLPVVTILSDVIHSADQEAIIGLVSKMAVDRSLTSSISDAREALINSVIDILNVFRTLNTSAVGAGALVAPFATRLVPLYVLALIKHTAFRVGISTKMDERVFAMERIKCLPLKQLMLYIYPNLYAIHNLVSDADRPTPLQLTFANIDRNGVYLLDTYDNIFIYICKSVHPQWLAEVLNVTQWAQIPDDGDINQTSSQPLSRGQTADTSERPIVRLPQLENMTSKRIHSFVDNLITERSFQPNFYILREDSRIRYAFLQYMYDDRNESAFSYYEFLQHLQQQIKN